MKSFEETLAEISAGWVADGVITAEQRQALLARHPASDHPQNRFVAILASVGGVLVTAGIALLIAAHWHELGDWWKIGGLVTLLAATHFAGWKLAVAPGRYPKCGDACFMAGSILFLLGIVLVSQIFHLNSRPPTGVLLWCVGIAPISWVVRARGAHFVSLVALVTWLAMEMDAADSWLRLRPDVGWNDERYGTAAFLLGSAVLFSGIALRKRAEIFAGLHEAVGLLMANVSLWALSFAWSQHFYTPSSGGVRWQPFVFFGLLVAITGLAAIRVRRSDMIRLAGWWALGAVAALWFLVAQRAHADVWLGGAGACVGLFLFNIGMIRTGLASGRESWINLGIAFIALNILTRYIDLFGTMLEGGIFFLVTGIIVLGLGFYLEKKRRSLVGRVREVGE